MKVCVCLYGLVQRSLHLTLKHLENFVFSKNCDIYIHTFDTDHAYADRDNGEDKPTKVSIDGVLKLKAKKCMIESEKDFNENFDFKKFEKFGDPFDNNFNSLHNLLRELHSVQKVYELIDRSVKYDHVIMTRADLCFDKPLNTIKLDNSKDFILTSKFNRASFNHNDFFAVGSTVKALEVWANRIDYAEDFCLEGGPFHQGLHPENLITYCIKNFEINNIFLDVKVDRVRADGKVVR